MTLLALDCSSKTASAAIVGDGKLLAQSFVNAGLTHSETLMPMIAQVLERARVTPERIDRLAATNGPGSFTGLRIGVSTALGLSFARDIPCVGVSSLEAAAWNVCHMGGVICALMDARLGQVYTALFDAESGEPRRLTEDTAEGADEVFEKIRQKNAVLVGDGAEMCYNAWEGTFRLAPEHLRYPTGYGTAMAALKKNEFYSGQALRAEYIRLPQAERERRKYE